MKFKVGDRVKVVEPAECVEDPNNRLGTGTILDADDREYFYVKVDSNTKPWWYAERCLRALPTPTPSITVGTQVRLTGVVVGPTRKEDDAQGVLIKGSAVEGLRGPLVFIKPDYLEVIRQPFKRGEVVYGTSGGDTYVVFNDERDGKVDVVDVTAGVSGLDEDAIDYERRP